MMEEGKVRQTLKRQLKNKRQAKKGGRKVKTNFPVVQ